jgi:polygalacturonase
MTKLANSVFNIGSGGLSIDECSGVIIGGSQTGAVNVIAGNNNQGLAPDQTTNLTIQGNYIGVGADGTTSIPNDAMGIDLK